MDAGVGSGYWYRLKLSYKVSPKDMWMLKEKVEAAQVKC